MVFPTIQFAAFFVVVLTLSWLLMPHPRLWKPFIIAASFFFYGYADARFTLLLATVTIVNQAAALAIDRWRDKRILIAAIAADLGLLGWFKYYGFFSLQVDHALKNVGFGMPMPLLQVALPVGISFYTFQAISYVIDVHRETIKPCKSIDFAVYQSFFPHLIAGPIVRASEFVPQLATPRDPRKVQATRAFFLIGGGLIKKVVIADLLATRLVDPVFNSPGQHSALEVLVAIYGYAVQIYCDFSAYTEMAIGLALLLGFTFPDNFNRPYTATQPAGLLAPLAHDALALAARLPLHLARRQPEGRPQDLPQPDADDAARRPVARRRLDVRDLGRHPRRRARGRALVG